MIMKAGPLLTSSLLFLALLSGYTKAATCSLATDTAARMKAAGYGWFPVVQLLNVTSSTEPTPLTPEESAIDLYTASKKKFDGRIKVSMRVVVPKKMARPRIALWLKNDFRSGTTETSTGKQVYNQYRLVFRISTGPGFLQERPVFYLLADGQECTVERAQMGFVAEDLRSIVVERLLKM